jgi:hypothetical protein
MDRDTETRRSRVCPAHPERRVEFEGKRYEWDVGFVARMGMGPVELTQRNARITPVSAKP